MTIWTGSPDREMDVAQRFAADLLTENLYLREQIAAALAVVEREVPETCYDAPSCEYYEDDPCPRCSLRAFLTVPDAVTLDVIEARRDALASVGATAETGR